VLYFPSGVYRVRTGLQLDASFASVVADGATIDASPLGTGAAVTVTGSAIRPYDQSVTSISGLKILGAGRSRPVTGLRFDRAPQADRSAAGPSHLTVRNCNVSGFRKGYSFENSCYNLELYSCDAYDCGTCINLPGGKSDSGERIAFYGGTLFNSELAVENRNVNSMLYLIGSSLDYNARQIVIEGAHVTLTDCHVEARDHESPPITVAGNGGSLHVSGGWFVLTGDHPRTVPAIVECALPPGAAGGVIFYGAFLNNLLTKGSAESGPRLAIGGGPVRLVGVQSYDITQNPRIIGEAQNRLRDGDFEGESPRDPFILADTAPVIDRLVGANIILSSSTDMARRGARSLRCRKLGKAGSEASFSFIVPITPGQIADFELYYRRPGLETGTIHISHGYGLGTLGPAGIPGLVDAVSSGATEERLPHGDNGWVRVASGEPTVRAPAWASCFFVQVNLVNFNGGDIYFDQAIITVIE
jgi:hypothetical protein